jgi:hypothetical protein
VHEVYTSCAMDSNYVKPGNKEFKKMEKFMNETLGNEIVKFMIGKEEVIVPEISDLYKHEQVLRRVEYRKHVRFYEILDEEIPPAP